MPARLALRSAPCLAHSPLWLTRSFPLPARCLSRNIDKVGGIDAYIMGTPDKKLQSDVAMDLRAEMLGRLVARGARQERRQQLLPAAAAAAADAAAAAEAAQPPL